jgi:ubiquinone/menaquinone biosynthesis C-methylase UbiE
MRHAVNIGAAVSVRAVYDSIAADYDRQLSSELDAKPIDRAVLCALVELVGTGIIADVGCGPGHVTRYLADHHSDVIGLDLSPQMIAIANARASELTFAVASMTHLPVADSSWGGAVALYSIIHMPASERARAFSEFARAIRPQG